MNRSGRPLPRIRRGLREGNGRGRKQRNREQQTMEPRHHETVFGRRGRLEAQGLQAFLRITKNRYSTLRGTSTSLTRRTLQRKVLQAEASVNERRACRGTPS